MKETIVSISAAALASLVGAAFAQEPPEGAIGRDTDGDGYISRGEVSAQSQRSFDRLDTDGDGIISFDEFDALSQARRSPAALPGPPGKFRTYSRGKKPDDLFHVAQNRRGYGVRPGGPPDQDGVEMRRVAR